MNDSITVEEQIQPLLKFGTYFSAILCVISFLIFWNIVSPFWISIFRFGSFIFFALTVLGYLRMLNRPLTVMIKSSNSHLEVFYKKKDKVVKEEEFERSTIKEVVIRHPKFTLTQGQTSSFRIHFTDTSNKLYLLEFSGRPLLFSPEETNKIKDYLQQQDINI